MDDREIEIYRRAFAVLEPRATNGGTAVEQRECVDPYEAFCRRTAASFAAARELEEEREEEGSQNPVLSTAKQQDLPGSLVYKTFHTPPQQFEAAQPYDGDQWRDWNDWLKASLRQFMEEAFPAECIENNRGSPIAPIKALIKLAAVMTQYLSTQQRIEIAEYTRNTADAMERLPSVSVRER
jgi:hypothetical protein